MNEKQTNLIKTELGDVVLGAIKNEKLRAIIKKRLSVNHFLFNYGDSRHNDNHTDDSRGFGSHNDCGFGSDHIDTNSSHADHGYTERMQHNDHTDYSDHKEHSEYSESQNHTDGWNR